MFEHSGNAAPQQGASVLEQAAIDAFGASLAAALSSASNLDDSARLDVIRALERLGCIVTAAQAHVSVELDDSQRRLQEARGVPTAQQGRGVPQQVALARRESPHRGQRHLGLAKAVIAELPATWDAWRYGHISEWKATMIARETACLSSDERLAVDRAVAGNASRVEGMSVREVVAAAQAEAARLDASSVVARRRLAESEARVTIRPAPDTMTWLTALLPVKDGVAVFAALTKAAQAAKAAGDPRGKGKVMADALVGRVLRGETTEPAQIPVSLNLVMTDHDLFGSSDEPAYLEGFGPVPAELGRELVAGSCSRRERVWLRRLFCHPRTGELIAADSRSRLFRGSLARFIRLRDQVCRTPWCDAPVRHLDHPIERASGGESSAQNSQGLCESCNYAKQAPGWRARPSPSSDGHEIETTLPTGHRYRSQPPRMIAVVRRAPIRIEYLLTG
jgi:5-methylcytosine-specific restriction endonuclease McrA